MNSPPQVTSTSRGGPARWNSEASGSTCFSTSSRLTTRQRVTMPAASVTWTSAPASTSRSGARAPSPCSASSTCPASTAVPSAEPGAGPNRYQPTRSTSSGSAMAPAGSTPTGSSGASTPDSWSRTGGTTGATAEGAAGRATTTGAGAGAAADGAAVVGVPSTAATGGPAAVSGRVTAQAVGRPTARAVPSASRTAGARTAVRSGPGGQQPAPGERGDDQADAGQRDQRHRHPVVGQTGGATGDTGGRRAHAGQGLHGQLVPGVGRAPRVDHVDRALAEGQVGRADRHGGGAGQDDVGADRAGRHGERRLVRVGQPRGDDGAAGPDVDRGRRGGVPDGDPGLPGRDHGHVVDERGQHRRALGGQVRHHGGVRPGGDVHVVGLRGRLGAG